MSRSSFLPTLSLSVLNLPVAMQYLARRLLSLSTAGAVSLYILHNRDKKRSTVFAFGDTQQNSTPILDDDIWTTRTHTADTSTDKVTFSLVPDKPDVPPLVPDVNTNMDTFSLIDDVYHEPFDNGLVLRQVQVFFRHGARTPLTKLSGLAEVGTGGTSAVPYRRYGTTSVTGQETVQKYR